MLTSWTLVGLSGVAVGFSAWLGARELVRGREVREVRHLWFSARNIGRAIVLVLITEAVFRAPEIRITWRVVLYAVGLVLLDAGIAYDLYDFGRRDRREDDRE